MNRKRIKYIFIVCLLAFGVWLAGEAILALAFPNASLAISRGWVVLVFTAACVWSLIRFYREDQQQKEDEENDNYKGLY